MPKTLAELRVDVWRTSFGLEQVPTDELELLGRIASSSLIDCQAEASDLTQLVRAIAERMGEELSDDLSEFVEDGAPTDFFYETLLGFLAREGSEDAGPQTEDADDDEEVDDTAVNANPRNIGLDTLFNLIRSGQLDLSPPWQRTVVWSTAKQRELIKSILLGIPIPSIILHHHNPGKIEERYSIIDGKQRLTAICRFLENKLKLPPFKVEPNHPLYPCRGRWFDKHDGRGRSLEAAYRNRIMTTQIPVLLFQDVPESRLRQIFNLYNVSSTRLNAAEIRNAIYQNNKIHKALFALAGELTETLRLPYLDPAKQELFTASLRQVLPSTRRFAAMDFICRYLGYSRAPTKRPPKFSALSTSTAINYYFDLHSQNDRPETIVKEIMRVFEQAQNLFNIEDDNEVVHEAFFHRNERGQNKFEALQAITSMVCARLLDRVEVLGVADPHAIDRAVRKVIKTVAYPEKQQYTTIWDHQARRFLGLAAELRLDLNQFDGGAFRAFADRMGQVRLEDLAA